MGRIYINAIRVINNIKTFGWRNTCAKLKKYLHLGSNYVDYNKWMHSHRLTDSERQEQCGRHFEYHPKFSITPSFHRFVPAPTQLTHAESHNCSHIMAPKC